jgi:NAD(P)-dependent dehydrogenase (short-subunit alcohol dehydrogenase family)
MIIAKYQEQGTIRVTGSGESMIVITGAGTGAGSRAAECLLARDQDVRIVGWSPDNLKWLGAQGAEILAGDQSNEHFLTKAFAGAEAVCLIVPGKPGEDIQVDCYTKSIEAAVGAISKSSVRKVVFLSSQILEPNARTVAMPGIKDIERKLITLENIDVVILRAGYVLENVFDYREHFTPPRFFENDLSPEPPINMATSMEIGEKIAELIETPVTIGNSVVNFAGEKWLCYF